MLRSLPFVLVVCLLGAGGYHVKTRFLDPPPGAASPFLPPLSESLPDNGGVPDQSSKPYGGSGQPLPGDMLAALPNFALEDPANARARRDALTRVDLVPNLDGAQKARLVDAVNRARSLGCIFVIPFESGRKALDARETEILVNGFKTASVRRLLADPTLVFVALGYTEKSADTSTNEKASTERAQNVLATMRARCGIHNTAYAVGMGGSDLYDPRTPARNRLVEVWAVYPGPL